MGTRAMYLGWSQYADARTNRPAGIGRRSSSGCIRMYPEDAEELYDLIEVGTKVTVVDQPIKLGWINGEIFMDAHSTQRKAIRSRYQDGSSRACQAASSIKWWPSPGGGASAGLEPDPQAVMERRGYPVGSHVRTQGCDQAAASPDPVGRALGQHRDDQGPSAAGGWRLRSGSCRRPAPAFRSGPITATAFVAVIDTPDRFMSSAHLAEWAGGAALSLSMGRDIRGGRR